MLEMNKETKEKMRRYFINSDPFLWNVLKNRNKKGRLSELKEMGFLKNYSEGSNFTYGKINQDLLVELGIEGILKRIVIKRVKDLFKSDILQYFRRCWEQGQTPTLDYLKRQRLYRKHHLTNDATLEEGWAKFRVSGYKEPAFVFFQIDTRYDFVERWTVFAGLWFEEIEPLFDSAK